MSLFRHICRHFDSTMTKSLLALLIIVVGILSIMNEQVRTIYEIKKGRIATFLPFYISGKDHTTTSIFDTIDYSAIQWMTIRQLGNYPYIRTCYFISFIDNSGPYIAVIPDDLLLR